MSKNNIINATSQFPNKRYPMPKNFSKKSQELWETAEPYAWKNNLLNKNTYDQFVDMCLKYDQWIKVNILINRQGMVIKSKDGTPKVNPAFKKADKLSKVLYKYYKKFGMTPMSRAKKGLFYPNDE